MTQRKRNERDMSMIESQQLTLSTILRINATE